MGLSPLPADWVARLRAQADQAPARPRIPLCWRDTPIGSVEPALVIALHEQAAGLRGLLSLERSGASVQGEDLTASLAAIANGLRAAQMALTWRDEQLAVRDASGHLLGSVERAVVRPLGIPTHAVHLIGYTPSGRHWVQQRSLTKANDPGLWDTLMGGMVPASDSVQQALERETWEEAGLRLQQLRDVVRGGQVSTRCPSDASPWGYVVETIDWYQCVVPDGVVPVNQDGEVAQFRLMAPADLRERLLAGDFTLEAALVILASA